MSITKVQINRATIGNLSGSRSFTSSSLASRVTTEATNVDNLQTDSGSFSTRVTDLVTASSSFSGSIATLRGAGSLQGVGTSDSPTFAGATITGTLTAQEIHTEFESASILFSSGSTQFGNSSDDVHDFKGNTISGSVTSTGSFGRVHIGASSVVIEDNGSGALGFRTNNAERFSVASNGPITFAENVNIDASRTLTVNGDLDVDGTANLDNTDIDGTLTVDGGNIVFNEDSADYDFRVESNANVNMLFVDGGQNAVGIGTNNAGANSEKLLIVGNDNVNFLVVSSSNDDNFISMGTFENDQAIIGFGNKATTPTALNFYAANRPPMGGSNLVMSLSGSGNVGIGTAIPTSLLTIHASTSNDGDVTVLRLNNDETALADGDGVSMMFGLGTDFLYFMNSFSCIPIRSNTISSFSNA